MQAFHSDRHLLPLPPGHRFPRSKYRLLRERVASLADLEAHEAQPVGDADLVRVHDPAYVAAVTAGTLGAAEQRAIGFPWSEEMVERSRRSVGATLAAARAALGRRRRRQPRRRNAPRVGVARQRLLRLQRRGGRIARPAGRGSAAQDRRRRPRRPPGRRHGGDLRRRPERVHDLAPRREELPVPEGRERPRRRLARRLRRRRVPATRSTGPSPCSARNTASDRSASPSTSPAPIRTRATASAGSSSAPPACSSATAASSRCCGALDIPVALAMAGGYGHDLDVTVAIQAATIEAAIAAWRAWRERGTASRREHLLRNPRLPTTIAAHDRFHRLQPPRADRRQ